MAENERQIREAAENLFSASLRSQRYGHQNLMRTPEIILSEDLIAGTRHHGKMSHIRRSFCLLVTFDLLLTSLMWLICTMIGGENIHTAFVDQIVHYRINTSLFDIVMAATCRFMVLLLFYALLYINHWIVIALETTSTCVFLIAKVFLFDWKRYDQPVFQVLLILSSFVLTWAEVLLFDLRVLPQEIQAKDWFRSLTDTERSPLQSSDSVVQNYRSTDVVSTFFTPMDSPNQSDSEENSRRNSKSSSKSSIIFPSQPLPPLTKEEMEEYKNRASNLLHESYGLLTSNAWKFVTKTCEDDVISSLHLPKPEGKILKITGLIDQPARVVVDRLFNEIEESPRWNKCILESFILQEIDENTDIVYQSTQSQGGGIIGPRDFIILRRRGKSGNFFISSGMSIPLESVPTRKHYIRGENGVGCWAAEEIPDKNQCRFTWILNTDLKGWIPQQIVDMAMSSVLRDFMKQVRKNLYETQVPIV